MSTHRKQSFAQIFEDASITLHNARHDPDILEALRPHYYDEAKLDQGLALYETAQNLHIVKLEQYGKQIGLTHTLHETWQEAHRTYVYHRNLAKRIFKNDPAHINNLLLFERVPTKLSLWIAQAASFYQSILDNPDTLLAIQVHIPIPRAVFETARDTIDHIQLLNNNQENQKAVAQNATKERDQALQELNKYLAQLKLVAKYALRDNQKLELILRRPIPSDDN